MVENLSRKYLHWFEDRQNRLIDQFVAYLKFASISADPKMKQDVIKCSNWVEAYVKKLGFETEVWDTGVNPVIFGQMIQDSSYPTILFYNHYDVQPVDPLDLWTTPPFEPRIDHNIIYARGACDDKGLNLSTFYGIEAFLEVAKTKKINIKVVIEGEEEVGSLGFSRILPQKTKELKADYLAIVDTGVPSMEQPCVVLGCRGIITLDVICQGSNTDLHSGMFGGIAYNPLRALSEVIAKFWDKDGKVAIDGFYYDVEEVDFSKFLHYDIECKMREAGIMSLHREEGCSPLESNTTRPTIEVNGLCGGYHGPGFKTVIPAKAVCKISCRLVPHQDPVKIGHLVAEFMKKNIAKGMRLDIELGHGGVSHRTKIDSPIVDIFCRAIEMTLGKKCGLSLTGGSVPITQDLHEASQAEVIAIGFGLDSDNIHAPDEHFGLDRLKYGAVSIATALEIISNEGFKK